MTRIVMGVNTWPEDGQEDFAILEVNSGETDLEAIERAKLSYGPGQEYYVIETPVVIDK